MAFCAAELAHTCVRRTSRAPGVPESHVTCFWRLVPRGDNGYCEPRDKNSRYNKCIACSSSSFVLSTLYMHRTSHPVPCQICFSDHSAYLPKATKEVISATIETMVAECQSPSVLRAATESMVTSKHGKHPPPSTLSQTLVTDRQQPRRVKGKETIEERRLDWLETSRAARREHD